MSINQFKQYLYGGRKIIREWPNPVIEDEDTYSDYSSDSTISFIEFEAGDLNIGDFIEPPFMNEDREDSPSSDKLFNEQYMRALLGDYPEDEERDWRLAQANIGCDSIIFIFGDYDDGMKDFQRLKMRFPPHVKFQIDFWTEKAKESDRYVKYEEMEFDRFIYLTYLITVDLDEDGKPNIVIEEYSEGVLKYTSRILEDEKGLYELLTKA